MTPKLEKFVKDKVESGRYHSASEVIREGLRLLEEQEQVREVKLAALREEIQKGLASGQSIPGETVFQELREKARERKKAHGRGRDAGYPAPPAQIPACGTTAPGSCLGS
ncbi:MAG TPA: type II toxin-antitoxin system ParD family antitoxin [Candidatus Saccharimonadia bacterium]|nr:type II toxin-antitoxin system ParD family antitoxin [Candidatus Saccharimonadia bacterium]